MTVRTAKSVSQSLDRCATDIAMFSVPLDQLLDRAVHATSPDLVQRITEVLELDLAHVLRLHVLDAIAIATEIANRSERRVLRQRRNVRRRVAVGQVGQFADLAGRQRVAVLFEQFDEQISTCRSIGQADEDSLRKASQSRLVQRVRQVGGAQHEHAGVALRAEAVQLDEELGLDAPCRLGLVLFAFAEQAVDLVDEQNRRLQFACDREQRLHQLLRFAEPFRGQRRGGYAEEVRVRFVGQRFGEQRLAAARWTWWKVSNLSGLVRVV